MRRAGAAARLWLSIAPPCPRALIEAELFGYGEGAFTGARKGGSSGLVKEADGGTLFLDEIGDMPVTLQAVLLRFLDDWTVRPVGGAKRQVDVLSDLGDQCRPRRIDRQRSFSLGPVVSPQYARGHFAAARASDRIFRRSPNTFWRRSMPDEPLARDWSSTSPNARGPAIFANCAMRCLASPFRRKIPSSTIRKPP